MLSDSGRAQFKYRSQSRSRPCIEFRDFEYYAFCVIDCCCRRFRDFRSDERYVIYNLNNIAQVLNNV